VNLELEFALDFMEFAFQAIIKIVRFQKYFPSLEDE